MGNLVITVALSPASQFQGLGDYETPSMHVCICVCVHVCTGWPLYFINLWITSPNLQRMVMAVKHVCRKFCTHFKKQHGRHDPLFKNHRYVVTFKILQLVVSDLYKM